MQFSIIDQVALESKIESLLPIVEINRDATDVYVMPGNPLSEPGHFELVFGLKTVHGLLLQQMHNLG